MTLWLNPVILFWMAIFIFCLCGVLVESFILHSEKLKTFCTFSTNIFHFQLVNLCKHFPASAPSELLPSTCNRPMMDEIRFQWIISCCNGSGMTLLPWRRTQLDAASGRRNKGRHNSHAAKMVSLVKFHPPYRQPPNTQSLPASS